MALNAPLRKARQHSSRKRLSSFILTAEMLSCCHEVPFYSDVDM